jgi:hypothetical protein
LQGRKHQLETNPDGFVMQAFLLGHGVFVAISPAMFGQRSPARSKEVAPWQGFGPVQVVDVGPTVRAVDLIDHFRPQVLGPGGPVQSFRVFFEGIIEIVQPC